jgi:hypothetical protein
MVSVIKRSTKRVWTFGSVTWTFFFFLIPFLIAPRFFGILPESFHLYPCYFEIFVSHISFLLLLLIFFFTKKQAHHYISSTYAYAVNSKRVMLYIIFLFYNYHIMFVKSFTLPKYT